LFLYFIFEFDQYYLLRKNGSIPSFISNILP